MTKEEIRQQIKELEEKLYKLENPPIRVVGQYDGWPHYSIDDLYGVCTHSYISDKYLIKCGNSFKTKEQAERRLENIKTRERIKRLAAKSWGGEKISLMDFDRRRVSFFINDRGDIAFNSTISRHLISAGQIFFADMESIDRAYEEIGEEKVKQYIICLLYTSPSPRD